VMGKGVTMRKALVLGMMSCLLGFGPPVSAAEIKIGYVDLQQVKATDEWKRLEDLFKAEVRESQVEVEKKRKELETAAIQYERQKPMLSESARGEREKELQRQNLEFKLWTQDEQKAIEKKRNEMTQQLWSRVSGVVEKVAKKKHLSLVIDYNPNPKNITTNFEKGFIYLAPEIDITDEVIKEFNALFKGKK